MGLGGVWGFLGFAIATAGNGASFLCSDKKTRLKKMRRPPPHLESLQASFGTRGRLEGGGVRVPGGLPRLQSGSGWAIPIRRVRFPSTSASVFWLAPLTALQNDLGRVYTYGYEETNPADHCGRSCGVRSEKSALGLNFSPLQRSLTMPSPCGSRPSPCGSGLGNSGIAQNSLSRFAFFCALN